MGVPLCELPGIGSALNLGAGEAHRYRERLAQSQRAGSRHNKINPCKEGLTKGWGTGQDEGRAANGPSWSTNRKWSNPAYMYSLC